MKCLRWLDSALVERDTAQPVPREGEVLVRVHAAGVTPTELLWYPTLRLKDGSTRAGPVLSHEFSGEVAELGEGVSGLSRGEPVYGMNDWFAEGALADYCVTRPEWIAAKPKNLSNAAAASVPISALTAWQGLFDRAKLRAGERVLIHGGAGAVGVFAIQLARSRGAYVITTVSARNAAFVKELGADEAIDYKAAPFEEKARDIDVVFDGVGGDTLRRSWSVLRSGGRLVTVAAAGETESDERTKHSFFIVEAKQDQLMEVGRLLDAGKLRAAVDAVLPFSQAFRAFDGTLEKSGRGKVVVQID